MPTLQTLTVELHVLILQSLPSREALSSAIRAVPQLYRAFTRYKSSVVSRVLLQAIPPELEADFITAFQAQEVWKYALNRQCKLMCPGCKKCRADIPELQRECNEIAEQFQNGTNEGRLPEFLTERTQVIKMWKFFSLFDRFTSTFCRMILPRLGRCSALDYSEKDKTTKYKFPSLSPNERARLLRAFIHCEIYVCVSQGLVATDYRTRLVENPAARFVKALASWEFEEVVCILHFYNVLLEQLYDRIEDDFVSTAERKDAILRAKSKPLGAECGLMGTLPIGCLWIFEDCSKKCFHARNIESLITCGAVAIGNLTTAPFRTAREVVLRSYAVHGGKSSILHETYRMGIDHDSHSTARQPWLLAASTGLRFEVESFKSPNFGWVWAQEDDDLLVSDSSNYHLIKQGYVFWDKERMTALEMYSVCRSEVDSFYEAHMDEDARSEEPSVDTRLEEEGVHWSVILEMSDDIIHKGIGEPVDLRNWDLIKA